VNERSEATRAALIAAARRLFVEKGYFATGTEEIVREAGVGTRGALYHHFTDKAALFLAVFHEVEQDLVGSTPVPEGDNALARLRAGLLGFLDASTTPEVQRILLIDGPAVLGWPQWRELEAQYGLGALEGLLQTAAAQGDLSPQPVGALAHLLLAAVDEAALFIANADDPPSARDEAVIAMDQLLVGLTGTPSKRAVGARSR
jgi:AcrR family transcriptional regulator